MVAQMRSDLRAGRRRGLRSQADAPIRLPPVDLITERVLALRALTESPEGARRRRPFGANPFLGRRQQRSDCPCKQFRRDMKPPLVWQLFERLECSVDWNTLAACRF